MKARVISLNGVEFEGDVNSLNLKTPQGELTILEHHEPLITLLSEGMIQVALKDEKEKKFYAKEGVLRVDSTNECTLLIR